MGNGVRPGDVLADYIIDNSCVPGWRRRALCDLGLGSQIRNIHFLSQARE